MFRKKLGELEDCGRDSEGQVVLIGGAIAVRQETRRGELLPYPIPHCPRALNVYLNRMGLLDSLLYDYCEHLEDSAEHTFFECDRWSQERRALKSALGCNCTPVNIGTLMVNSEANLDEKAAYVEKTLRAKKLEEKKRTSARPTPDLPSMGP